MIRLFEKRNTHLCFGCCCGKNRPHSWMSTLVDCYFIYFWYLGRVCMGSVWEENDTEKCAFHFADGASSSTATSWAGCVLPAGLLTCCLHVSVLTKALHVEVYVMCVCRRHMWAVKASRKGKQGKRKRGRNGFDEHQEDQEIKQNKGTRSPNSQQSWINNTKSPKQSCKTYFFASLLIGVQGKACVVCRERS